MTVNAPLAGRGLFSIHCCYHPMAVCCTGRCNQRVQRVSQIRSQLLPTNPRRSASSRSWQHKQHFQQQRHIFQPCPATSDHQQQPQQQENPRQRRQQQQKQQQQSAGQACHGFDNLLQQKLCVGPDALEPILTAPALVEGFSHANTAAPDTQLAETAAGLDRLLALFSPQQVLRLLQQQPLLLTATLLSWLDFFEAYGFSNRQTANIISQSPDVLVKGSLVTAGDALLHLQQLGFDAESVRHRVIAYCPQVLMMSAADINTLIRLWDKFKVGVDERQS